MGRHSLAEDLPPRPPDGRVSTGQHAIIEDRTPRPPEDARVSTGRHSIIEVPPPPPLDGRVSTGHHRAVGKAATRRRIAMWPIVAAALILFMVVGLMGWGWANNVLNGRAEAQVNGCAEGDSTMNVVVAPGAARAVAQAATKWNQAKTVVHAHCVHINVESIASDQVYAALTGQAGLDSIGGIPAAWIPEATDWTSRLAAARPDLICSPAEPVTAGYAYVGLGGDTMDEVAERAAQVFRDFLAEPAQQAAFTSAGLT